MSASRAIQAASIFYLDSLLATASALYTSSCLLFLATLHFFYIDIFSKLFFWILSYSTPSSRLWGKPCTVLFYISFSEFAGTSTDSTISYLVSLCLVSVELFSCLQFQTIVYFIDIFLHEHFFLIFSHFTPRSKRSSTSSPTFHSLLLLECTPIVILYRRGRGNPHFLFSRDWKSLFIKWNLL